MVRAILKTLWTIPPEITFSPERDQQFVLEDTIRQELGKDPFHPELDFPALEQYHRLVYEAGRPPWREIILSLTFAEYLEGVLSLRGRRLDSATNMAIRLDTTKSQSQKLFQYGVETIVNAITFSPDETEILLGVRGGYVMSGTQALPPAGVVAYKETADPLTIALHQETTEELGLTTEQIQKVTLFGHFAQTAETHAPNNSLVYKLTSKIPLTDLIETHRTAFSFYQLRKENGASEREARTTLRAEGFPKDAWEHTTLYTIPNTADAILKLFHDHVQGETLAPGLYGSFPLYLLFRFGEHALKEYLKDPLLKQQTDSSELKIY